MSSNEEIEKVLRGRKITYNLNRVKELKYLIGMSWDVFYDIHDSEDKAYEMETWKLFRKKEIVAGLREDVSDLVFTSSTDKLPLIRLWIEHGDPRSRWVYWTRQRLFHPKALKSKHGGYGGYGPGPHDHLS